MNKDSYIGADDVRPATTSPPRQYSQAQCYIGLGSNVGDRAAYLRQACELLGATPRTTLRRLSSVYESEPWGYVDQRAFLNAVVEIVTELGPLQLLCALKSIEQKLERKTRFRWGPREIDLDLLLYDDRTVVRRGLTVPHAAMYQRAFVLAPLAELAPWVKMPGGEPIRDALARLDPSGQQATVQTLTLASG